ncbi:hypothetical protein [Acidisoma sp. C75]
MAKQVAKKVAQVAPFEFNPDADPYEQAEAFVAMYDKRIMAEGLPGYDRALLPMQYSPELFYVMTRENQGRLLAANPSQPVYNIFRDTTPLQAQQMNEMLMMGMDPDEIPHTIH